MRILVFQHLAIEHPGIFRTFWREAGHEWTVVELDEGGTIPDLGGFDLLVVMGGPMDVWQEDLHPWLRDEKAAIRTWVRDLKRPYLGICLGHQLLAAALGGCVGQMRKPEVGMSGVSLRAAGRTDPILSQLGPRFPALHWHGAEVMQLPVGAEALASTEACCCQVLRWGRHAYGFQCHVEITEDTVHEWNAIPEYRDSLQATLGPAGAADLAATVAGRIDELNATARRINDVLLAIAAEAEMA